MIVTCHACQARFRVADEKVGPRGAKVRCSRCQAVFQVPPPAQVNGRAAAAGPPAASPAPARPPAAAPTRSPSSPAAPAPAPATPPVPAPQPSPPTDPFSTPPALRPASDPFAPPPPKPDPFGASPFGAPSADPFGSATGAPDPFAATRPPSSLELAGPVAEPPPLPPDPFGRPPVAIPAEADPAGTVPPDPFGVPPDPFGLEAPEPAPASGASAPAHGLDLGELLARASDAAPSRASGGHVDLDGGFSEQDFGLPASEGAASGLELDLPTAAPAVPPAASEAPRPPARPPEPPAATSSAPPAAAPVPPAEAPGPAPEPEPAARAARVRAVAVNLFSLAALLALAVGFFAYGRGDGRLGLKLLLRRDGAAPVSAPGQPLIVAAHVRSGVYETAAGRGLLFVRGELQPERGARGPIRVRVTLLDGERVAAEAEGLAGAVPSPEELYAMGSPADAERVRKDVARRAPARAGAGEWLPFLVPVAEAAGDRGLSLRVRAETAGPAGATPGPE